MIAGLLAMLLVTATDTTRIAALPLDTLRQGDSTLIASSTPADAAVAASTGVDTVVALSALPALSVNGLSVRRVLDPKLVWPSAVPADTVVKKKRVLVEYSDWYGRRLAIHRTLTWAMIPLFAVSYYTGERLARDGRINSPYAVRALHPYAATGATVVFGVNTVTGLWNLWDARHDPEGRTRRIIHSVLFMVADAGFAYAGSIGEQARNDSAIRSKHRTIALSSMGVSYVSMMIMLLGGK